MSKLKHSIKNVYKLPAGQPVTNTDNYNIITLLDGREPVLHNRAARAPSRRGSHDNISIAPHKLLLCNETCPFQFFLLKTAFCIPITIGLHGGLKINCSPMSCLIFL
jgi:hypothetical protein